MQLISRRTGLLLLLLIVFALGAISTAYARGGRESLESRLDRVYQDVPAVVQPEEVHALIREGRIPGAIFLIDTRSPEEWNVSRLPGAFFLNYRGFSVEELAHLPKDARIILYCAVGRRSGNVGEELRTAGYTDVSDMYGGILRWAEKGLPLVDDNGSVNRVHGSRRWYGKRLRNPDIEVVY